jgi:transposase
MEPVLHFGLGGRDAERGTGADRTAGCSRVFPGLNAGPGGHRSGDAFRLVQEIIAAKGHAVLVANPRLMEGAKRRKHKNDRIDANKLAQLGRGDRQSLHPIQHWSGEVRQDLVLLRARTALVRTELITALGKMLRDKDREKSKRVMQAMFRITKIDIRGLEHAYEQG